MFYLVSDDKLVETSDLRGKKKSENVNCSIMYDEPFSLCLKHLIG